MAIENVPNNQDVDIEITEDIQPEEVLENLGIEVELPEEMNIQGDMTSSFEITPEGMVNPIGEEMNMVMMLTHNLTFIITIKTYRRKFTNYNACPLTRKGILTSI